MMKARANGRAPADLRSQLVLGSVVVVLLTFSVLGVLLAAFFGHYFTDGRLTGLTYRARSVGRLMRRAPARANPRITTMVRDTGGHVWVVSAQGAVVRQFGHDGFGPYTRWVTSAQVQDILAGHTRARAVPYGQSHPQEEAVVGVPVAPAGAGPPLAVLWVAPVGGAAILRAVAARLAVVATLGLLVAVLLFAWLGARLARPIRGLGHAATRIAAGEFEVPVVAAGSSEVRSLAQSLREMALQLQEVDRHRRDFLADVGHELRTPLAALRGALEGIRAGTAPPAVRARYVDLAVAETARLARLVDDLLALSRAQAGHLQLRLEDVDFKEVLLRVALSLEPVALARDISFSFDVPDAPVVVQADPDRLSQVLWNLLDNAARHTPPGGVAQVSVAADPPAVLLRVSNPGAVIAGEAAAHLFERFARGASGDAYGAGLGLAIVRTLVELHHGLVQADAPPEGGLCVTVRWPVKTAGQGAGAPHTPASA